MSTTAAPDLEALARAIAEAHGSRGAWALVLEDERGEVKCYSNVSPASVVALAKRFHRQERDGKP